MKTAMESIKEMVDVNTVVGDPVETADGMVIIPVSRVSFGFAAGGGEYGTGGGVAGGDRGERGDRREIPGGNGNHPFGGGSGAGVSVQPVGFLVVGNGHVRLLPVDGGAVIDRLIELAPQVIGQIQSLVRSGVTGDTEDEDKDEKRKGEGYRG